MTTIQLPNAWKPRAKQLKLWSFMENDGKRAIYAWHRRYGKDDVGLHWTSVAAHQRVGTYWYMLPEAAQARKAIWEAINPHTGIRRIDEAFPPELRSTSRDQEMFIRFKLGSTWQVVGSDNYNSLVGSPPVGIVCSEWALANPAAWGYLMPILRENGGWIMFNSTPRGRNHMYTMLQAAKEDEAWFAEVLDVHDTGALSEAELAAELRQYKAAYGEDIGQNLYDQEYLCSFDAAILGAYYGKELRALEKDGRIDAWPHDPALPVHTAWDLGIGDSTAIWFWQAVGSEVRVVDFYEAHGHAIPHYAANVNGRTWIKGDDWVPHDAKIREYGTGKTRVETMREHGLRPRLVPDHRLEDGINAARVTLPRCFFNREKTWDAIEGLRQYRADWDDQNRCFRDKPKHDWTSHRADAFRYLAMAWREVAGASAPEPGRQIRVGYANTATLDDLWDSAPKQGCRI